MFRSDFASGYNLKYSSTWNNVYQKLIDIKREVFMWNGTILKVGYNIFLGVISVLTAFDICQPTIDLFGCRRETLLVFLYFRIRKIINRSHQTKLDYLRLIFFSFFFDRQKQNKCYILTVSITFFFLKSVTNNYV